MMCVRVAVWADGGARCPHPGGRMSECSFTFRYLIVTPHRRNRESTHVLVTHSELLHSAFKESVLWNFHPEQIFNCWGCLWPTRVPGPAPGVRFLLSLPIGTEKLHRGLYAFFFIIIIMLLLQSHTCITLWGPQHFCLDVIPTFQSEKKVPGISPAFLWRAVLWIQQGPQRGVSFSSITAFETESTDCTFFLAIGHPLDLLLQVHVCQQHTCALKLHESMHTENAEIKSFYLHGKMFTRGVRRLNYCNKKGLIFKKNFFLRAGEGDESLGGEFK